MHEYVKNYSIRVLTLVIECITKGKDLDYVDVLDNLSAMIKNDSDIQSCFGCVDENEEEGEDSDPECVEKVICDRMQEFLKSIKRQNEKK